MKRKYSKQASTDTWLHSQLRAANALVKFCEEQQFSGAYFEQVTSCRNSLGNGDINAAVAAYKMVPLGGNGCFNDWQPTNNESEESVEYDIAVFEALVERWSRLMSLSVNSVGS